MKLFLLTVSIFICSFSFANQIQVIYGKDERLEPWDIFDAKIRDLGNANAAMIPLNQLKPNSDGSFRLISNDKYGKYYNLCTDERFYSQPSDSDCSAFLVAPDIVATAGHCVAKMDCKKFNWVFGYEMLDEQKVRENYSADQVYQCDQVLGFMDRSDEDWALVKLDRNVTVATPLKLSSGQNVKKGTSVFNMSFPLGLPLKFSMFGKVRSWGASKNYFTTSIDVASGSSGSPILNKETLEVEGILVRGEDDFVKDIDPKSSNSCQRLKKCTEFKCTGEDVTSISVLNIQLQKYFKK